LEAERPDKVYYWKQKGQIKFYYRGGIVGIRKDLVREIRESDLPYKEEVVEKKAPQTPEITSKEAEKKAGEETKTKSKDIDVAYYKREKRALMEKHREAREKLKQATKVRNKAAIREAKKEIKAIKSQLTELAIKLKEENNGMLPAWWHSQLKPE
jgi:seryl-tRNA synthetase